MTFIDGYMFGSLRGVRTQLAAAGTLLQNSWFASSYEKSKALKRYPLALMNIFFHEVGNSARSPLLVWRCSR
jgi:hypothetical protein